MRLILQVDQEGIKEMKTILSIIGIVVLGFFLLTTAGISPAVGQSNQLGGDERPVMVASETPSFGTEDWVGPEKQEPVVAMKTPSFGTEDWVGPEKQEPVVAMKTPSFGTEDWVGPEKQEPVVAMKTPSFGTEDWTGTMEFSEALGAGAIPEPVPEKLNLDDYNPD
jgi:hypothetical protein